MFWVSYFVAAALHKFVFFPNKLVIRSSAEFKFGATGMSTASSSSTSIDNKSSKTQSLETIMFRLVTFIASAVSLPFKNFNDVNQFSFAL